MIRIILSIPNENHVHCASQVKHENIVHVREIVVGAGMDDIFMVMEYVEHDLKVLAGTR